MAEGSRAEEPRNRLLEHPTRGEWTFLLGVDAVVIAGVLTGTLGVAWLLGGPWIAMFVFVGRKTALTIRDQRRAAP